MTFPHSILFPYWYEAGTRVQSNPTTRPRDPASLLQKDNTLQMALLGVVAGHGDPAACATLSGFRHKWKRWDSLWRLPGSCSKPSSALQLHSEADAEALLFLGCFQPVPELGRGTHPG